MRATFGRRARHRSHFKRPQIHLWPRCVPRKTLPAGGSFQRVSLNIWINKVQVVRKRKRSELILSIYSVSRERRVRGLSGIWALSAKGSRGSASVLSGVCARAMLISAAISLCPAGRLEDKKRRLYAAFVGSNPRVFSRGIRLRSCARESDK